MARADDQPTSLHELLGRVARLQRELLEAREGRVAAEQKLTWALMTFATLVRLDEARAVAEVYRALDDVLAALLARCVHAVYLLDAEGACLRLAHVSPGERFGPPQTATLGDGLVGRAAAEQRTVHGRMDGATACAVPFGAPPAAAGALLVCQLGGAPTFDADRVQLTELVGRHAGDLVRALSPEELRRPGALPGGCRSGAR